MIDTIACFIQPPKRLDDTLFNGGVIQENFDERDVTARLYRNPPQGVYEPRVTYWRSQGQRSGKSLGNITQTPNEDGELDTDRGLIKIEFSVPKLAGVDSLTNVTEADINHALNLATAFVRSCLHEDLPDVRRWIVQRVDYAWMWEVGHLMAAYMGVLQKLNLRTYSRHPFGVNEGVVWKSDSTKGRWVKFYNKTREQKRTDTAVLRFEISNYRDAVRYMCDAWFGCDRVVGEVVKLPRALYCMAWHWDVLGLGKSDSYGAEELMMMRLKDRFSLKHLPRAAFALQCIHKYGRMVYSDDVALMSKSTYYAWRKRLSDAGFLATQSSSEDDVIIEEYLDALHLPTSLVYTQLTNKQITKLQNLGTGSDAPAKHTHKNLWKNLAVALGLTPSTKMTSYLIDEFEAQYANS